MDLFRKYRPWTLSWSSYAQPTPSLFPKIHFNNISHWNLGLWSLSDTLCFPYVFRSWNTIPFSCFSQINNIKRSRYAMYAISFCICTCNCTPWHLDRTWMCRTCWLLAAAVAASNGFCCCFLQLRKQVSDGPTVLHTLRVADVQVQWNRLLCPSVPVHNLTWTDVSPTLAASTAGCGAGGDRLRHHYCLMGSVITGMKQMICKYFHLKHGCIYKGRPISFHVSHVGWKKLVPNATNPTSRDKLAGWIHE
jgi:hypothetical protein